MTNQNEKIFENESIDSLCVKSFEVLEINTEQIAETSVNKITFNDCIINKINLGAIFKKQLIINGGSIKDFQIHNAEIKNHLHINHNSEVRLKISNLKISESIFEQDFSFHECDIECTIIKNVDYNSLSEFINVQFNKEFDFHEITYKGFCLFDDCIFNTKANFKYIIFEKFTSFRNSIFNKGIDLDYTSSDKDVNFWNVKGLDSTISQQNTSQETYRIIKNQFENLNNKIEANKYHALEMKQHRTNIWKNIYNNCEDYKLIPDGLVSLFHWASSNHSTSWFRALLLIFIVSFVTNVFLGNDSFDFSVNGLNNIFKYINILSNIEDFNQSYIAMTVNKVFLGYLYYQFVTAVRKDTRK